MFVAASTSCFSDKKFEEACQLLTDLEYDKVEIWLSEKSDHLKPSVVAADPERFILRFRETTRLTPIALYIEEDIDQQTLAGLSKLAKLLRIAQITLPASPLGTPFNTEIDRLRGFLDVVSQDGVRISVKTKTGHLTEDPLTAIELCQSARGLGLTLDPSYYICGPNKNASFDEVFPHVYHMHLRDTTPQDLQVQIGLGEIDYSGLVSQLRRQNYNGMLSVDLIPSLVDPETRPLELRKMRMLLDTLL